MLQLSSSYARSTVGAVLSIAVAIGLAACGSSSSSNNSTPSAQTSASAAPATNASAAATTGGAQPTLNVVSGNEVPDPIEGYDYVAAARGYFTQEGVKVNLATPPSGTVAMSDVVSGRADVDYGSLEPLPAAVQSGAKVVTIFQQAYSPLFSVAYFNPAVHGIPGLKGRTIGIVSASSASVPLLNSVFAKEGLKPGAVTTVPVGLGATTVAAVKAKRIDADLLTPEFGPYLAAAKIPYTTEPLPGLDGNYPGFGAVVSRQTLSSKRDALVKYLRAVIKAEKFCQADVAGCAAAYKSGAHSTVPVSLLQQELAIDNKLYTLSPKAQRSYGLGIAANWQTMIDIQHDAGVIKPGLTPTQMFANDLVSSANGG